MHGNYQVIYKKTSTQTDLIWQNFYDVTINEKVMQIFDVRRARLLCDFFIEVKFESYHTASNK